MPNAVSTYDKFPDSLLGFYEVQDDHKVQCGQAEWVGKQ